MRFASRIDRNQTAIVKALRKAGCEVLSLAAVGIGCPDLIACRANVLTLIEVKDGRKSASRRQLTAHQIRFHKDWPVQIVTNESEALKAVGLQSGKQPEAGRQKGAPKQTP
jgi:hypothetical protein